MLNILRTSLKTGLVTEVHPDQSQTDSCRGRPQIHAARCDLSALCADVCPSKAITVNYATCNTKRWQLDLARCVFCGLCSEACPNQAIEMTHDFELAVKNRVALITEVIHQVEVKPEFINCTEPIVVDESNPPSEMRSYQIIEERIGNRIQRLLKRSLHIRHMAAGSDNSTDWEISALMNPVYDIQRLGIDFVASPRHADLLLVTGAVTRNLEPALRATYEAMPLPRLVVAAGNEACGGGVVHGSYAVAGGVDRLLSIDVYVPGDPPRPQALIYGLLVAANRIKPKLVHNDANV